IPGANGKIDPTGIERAVRKRSDIHYPKPRAVSITQATEVGTVYSVDEVKAIWAKTKQFGLTLHMDGARFANAVASLGVKPKEITSTPACQVISFGLTPSDATALAKRAPSMCNVRPNCLVFAPMALTSSTE